MKPMRRRPRQDRQGATFDDIAKERELKPTDTDIGSVAKSDIIDPVVADAALRSRRATSASR